jgi:hypothetical protein
MSDAEVMRDGIARAHPELTAVVDRICAERGWNKDHLSIEQVMEIRQDPEWKDAK